MSGNTPSAGYENPYKTSSLDPRVDGGKPRPLGESTNLSSQGNTRRDPSGSSGTTGFGTGAGTGTSQPLSSTSGARHGTNEPASSTLTSTADSTSRSAEYGQSTSSKGLDAATSPTSTRNTTDQAFNTTSSSNTQPSNTSDTRSQPYNTGRGYTSPFDNSESTEPYNTSSTRNEPYTTGTSSTHPKTSGENQGMMSKVLGAVGLGGAGAAAANALGYGDNTDSRGEMRDTSAIASQPGLTSQETGPPKHYRRESIPTTAYPAGPSSPRAVAPPVGGAQPLSGHSDSRDSQLGRNAGFGTGSGAYSASQPGDAQAHRENFFGEPTSSDRSASGLGSGTATSGVPQSGQYGSDSLRENIAPSHTGSGTQPTTRTTIHDLITTGGPPEVDHTGRNAGLAGTAIAAGAGAGALGLHEHNRHLDTSSTTYPSATTGSTGFSQGSSGLPQGSPGFSQGPAGTSHGSTGIQHGSRDNPIDALAAAPGRYDSQDARSFPSSSTAPSYERERQRDDRSARDTALGAGAGSATGSGVSGLRDHNREPTTSSTTYPTGATGSSAPTYESDRPREDHTGRNTTLGAGAGVAAGAGAYGLHEHNKEPTTLSLRHPTGNVGSTALPDRSRDTTSGTFGGSPSQQFSQELPDRARDTSSGTFGSAPGQHHNQGRRAPYDSTATDNVTDPRRQEDHTARNAALGAGAGVAAGGAAYAARDNSREEEAARRAAADREQQRVAHEREKDLAKQREHQEKVAAKERKEHEHELEKQRKEREHELEKQRKAEEKQHHKAEKEHEKELEKQHKAEEKQHHQEEKERSAAAVAAEQREKARLLSEEEDRMRRERESRAGVAGAYGTAGAVAGTGAFGHEKDRRSEYDNTYGRDQQTLGQQQPSSQHDRKHSHEKHAHEEKEKKPGFFKRIFKSRKNKDTGLDEEYSTDEEDSSHGHHGTAAAAGVGAGTGAATTGSHVPTHHSDTKGRNVLGSGTGTTDRTSMEPRDPITGLAYDPAKDPEAARRLSREPGSLTGGNSYTINSSRGTDSAPMGTGSAAAGGVPIAASGKALDHNTSGHNSVNNTMPRDAAGREVPAYSTTGMVPPLHQGAGHVTTDQQGRPIEPKTGLPYDPSKDPEAAARLEGHDHGLGGTDHGIPSSATEPFGVIGEHHR